MKQVIIVLISIIAFISNLNAQNNSRVLNYISPSNVSMIDDALYNNIEFVDDRPDVEFNVLKINQASFENELKKMVNSATMNTASKDGTLLLQLRNLRMEDLAEKNKAIVNFRANLYQKNGSEYYLINSFESKMIMPDKNQYQGALSDYISDYVIKNLKGTIIEEEIYTIDDVHNISLIEKQQIPLYSDTYLTDGVYETYEDFKRQEPLPYEITSKFKGDELKEVKIPSGNNNKLTKVSPKNVYAVVVDGRPYIATDKKYIPLYRDGDDFLFEDDETTSRTGIAPSFSIGIGSGGYRGGGIGIGIVTHQQKHKVTYVIDHLNGTKIALPE